jgi:hypothetical protein
MPSWSEGKVALLAATLGVPEAMEEAGFDVKDIEEVLTALAVRADGNPLYATFLCRTIRDAPGETTVLRHSKS